jgi:hypothetical protein
MISQLTLFLYNAMQMKYNPAYMFYHGSQTQAKTITGESGITVSSSIAFYTQP